MVNCLYYAYIVAYCCTLSTNKIIIIIKGCCLCVFLAPLPSHSWLKMLQTGSILVLVLQNTSLVLVMRYSRTRAGDMYIATTAVVASELVKLVFCLAAVLYENHGNFLGLLRYLRDVSDSESVRVFEHCFAV